MISFCVLIIGFLIVIRTFQQISAGFLLSKKEEGSLLCLLLLVLIIVALFSYQSQFLLWCSFGIFLISLIIIQKNISKLRNLLFQKRLLMIVDNLYHSVKAGQSLRASLQEEALRSPNWCRSLLHEVLQKIQIEKTQTYFVKSSAVAGFTEMVWTIDRRKFGIVQALNQYRMSLKMQENFRRRSSKIYSQVYSQCVILVLLFLMILVFNLTQFPWSEVKSFVGAAVTFFVSGLFFIYKVGRNIKWKM